MHLLVVRVICVLAAEKPCLSVLGATTPNVDTTTTGSDLLKVDRTCRTVDPQLEDTDS